MRPDLRQASELASGCVLIVCWMCLLAAGLFVGTEEYIKAINPSGARSLGITVDQFVRFQKVARQNEPLVSLSDFRQMKRENAERLLAAMESEQRGLDPDSQLLRELKAAADDIVAKLESASAPHLTREDETVQPGPAAKQLTVSKPGLDRDMDQEAMSPPTLPLSQLESWRPIPDITVFERLRLWIVVILCYTMTNVALLCCVAAVLGALYANSQKQNRPPAGYLSGVIQGFIVYLAIVSGLLVIGEQPFEATSPEKYVRLAGIASILSFWGGYSPSEIAKAFSQVVRTGRSAGASP